MKKKLHFLIFGLVLMFMTGGRAECLAADSWEYPTLQPDGKFGGGAGSQSDPYLINNAQHLADLAYMVNERNYYKDQYFRLTTDITLNDNVLKADGTPNTSGTFKSWRPIGMYGVFSDYDFMGTFDGGGHTIRGLYMMDVDRAYQGLFGSIKNAVVKNLNFEDCMLKGKFDTNFSSMCYSNIGVVVGKAYESVCKNLHVSKAWIEKTEGSDGNYYISGVIGSWHSNSSGQSMVIVSNSSFDGTITINVDKNDNSINCAGLITTGNGIISDCTVRGNMYINNPYDDNEVDLGISAGGLMTDGYGSIRNSVNYMNIHFYSSAHHGQRYDNASNNYYYYVGAFAVSQFAELKNCVNFGNVYVGKNDGQEREMKWAKFYGMCAKEMEDCANYGSIIFSGNFKSQYPPKIVAGMSAANYTRCINVQNHDDIPNIAGNTKAYPFLCEYGDKTATECHYYYKNTNSAGDLFSSADIPSDAVRHTNLADFKSEGSFFTSDSWGKMDVASNEYNGFPLPIACGGIPTEYTGNGTENNPYIINTEADLNRLKNNVNNGGAFENAYFKLGSDINMSGVMDYSIGFFKEKPFKGHLDGNGHAIVGLRNTLFGYMYGTVKNLALVDCNIESQSWTGAIAEAVGDEDNKAEVSNCYVSGVVQASGNNQILLGGICGNVANGSSVHDSYFKGHLVAKAGFNGPHIVGGIAGNNGNSTVDTTNPKGIYNCYASFEYHKEDLYMSSSCFMYGISGGAVEDCYVVTPSRIDWSNAGCTVLNSESELNEKFAGKAGWLQGVYRPLLASAKHYEAKSPEGTTAYFDAIPEANPKKNYFYNISIDDPYSDVSLWNLPNMAVYVPSEHKDYITNGYLDQSSDFQYKRSAGATATAGQLRYDLTQNVTGYHMICLPGIVERSDLPKDSKVMIVGKIQALGETELVNVVMVDTIPAGVPCMLYVPTSSVAKDEKISLVMRSGIVSEPIMNEAYSDFKGTFSKKNDLTVWTCTTVKINDKNKQPYFDRNTTAPVTVLPFTAWLANANRVVQIVDYILLDEENSAMTVTLANWNEQTINLKMRRTVKGGKWNTICLPFDMTAGEIAATFGEGTLLETFGGLTYDSSTETTTLEFSEATSITAGTPYLLKPGKVSNVSIFDIKSKEIKCESADYVPEGTKQDAITAEGTISLAMQGEYNKRIIDSNDYTQMYMYIISGDKIYYVDSEVELKGFRCYFVADETAGTSDAAKLFSGARLMHFDGSSTDLRLIKADAVGEGSAVYDLLGRKRDRQTKGLVIKNGIKVLKN